MAELISLNNAFVHPFLPMLLSDKTTQKNIVFATDSYADQGASFAPEHEITDNLLPFLDLKPRILKSKEEQALRTRTKAEVYTPKVMVKKMVDMLEQENPGCFDMPDKTFIDLYMKSGLYITEIVKRLYQSAELKRLYPDPKARLKHIFEKQVYGLAPTEIIYRIATNFILGFDKDVEITKHIFRQVDALPYAKEGKLDQLLDELFGQ